MMTGYTTAETYRVDGALYGSFTIPSNDGPDLAIYLYLADPVVRHAPMPREVE